MKKPPFTLCISILFLFLIPFASVSASPKDELEQTKKDLEVSKEKQAKLDEQTKAVEAELEALQKKLIRAAEAVQKAEAEVTASEEKLRILDEQVKAKNAAMAEQKKRLGALIQTALRLSRLPPEAALVMPDEFGQSMKAARAMRMTSDGIRDEIGSINLQLKELNELERKLAARKADIVKRQQRLASGQQELEKRLGERKTLQDGLNKEQRQEAEKAAALAKKAENLQGLVSKLRQQERTSEDRLSKKGKKSFVGAKGDIRPPVAGKIVQHFGDAQPSGGGSKGLVIESRRGAQVVAPFDGEVVYAGTFLNYGRLVIIRHNDDFHTLLAGLSSIDTRVGEFLLEGEPIGAMGDDESENRLYIELRKDNQPIDPEPWIKTP